MARRPARTRPAHTQRRRPHFFRPVPVRARKDGWSIERQCAFLAELYVTGSVRAAAASVGKSAVGAYALRKRDDAASFTRAWDSVLAKPGIGKLPPLGPQKSKLTQRELVERVETGLVQPVIYRGRMTAILRKADNSALLELFSRTNRRRLLELARECGEGD